MASYSLTPRQFSLENRAGEIPMLYNIFSGSYQLYVHSIFPGLLDDLKINFNKVYPKLIHFNHIHIYFLLLLRRVFDRILNLLEKLFFEFI